MHESHACPVTIQHAVLSRHFWWLQAPAKISRHCWAPWQLHVGPPSSQPPSATSQPSASQSFPAPSASSNGAAYMEYSICICSTPFIYGALHLYMESFFSHFDTSGIPYYQASANGMELRLGMAFTLVSLLFQEVKYDRSSLNPS